MGLFDKVVGNATKVNEDEINDLKEKFINEDETVISVYKLVRDIYVFTDKRIIYINKQGVTGSKVEYHSIFYKSISRYSIESSGTFDTDSELKVYVSTSLVIDANFSSKVDIYEIGRIISKYSVK